MIVRLRVALFGGITTVLAIYLFWVLMGRGVPVNVSALILASTVLFVGVGVFNRHVCALLTGAFSFVTDIPLDLAKIWIGATHTEKDARKAAFQRIYNIENRVYVFVAGYQTSCTFGASVEHVRDDLP